MSFSELLFGPKVPAVTVEQLHTIIKSGGKFYLLDVRTQGEYDEAHVGVTNALIPYDIVNQHVDRLPADKSIPIYCICRSGRRSAHSTQLLRSVGYEQVFNVTGGIIAWARLAYDVRSGTQSRDSGERPPGFFSLA